MDLQSHSCTHRIRRLSYYLHMVLNGIRFLLYLGWPGIIYVGFFAQGHLPMGNNSVFLAHDDYILKAVILTTYVVALITMLGINRAFRQLMRQYMRSEIFSNEAVSHVKATVKGVVAYIFIYWLQALIGIVINSSKGIPTEFSALNEVVVPMTFVGVMFTLLWALEIGRDLYEESEGTI